MNEIYIRDAGWHCHWELPDALQGWSYSITNVPHHVAGRWG